MPSINKEAIEELETLFEFAPPQSIQKSLRTVLFSYLMNTENNMIPEDFNAVVSDLYYLTDFIQKREDSRK